MKRFSTGMIRLGAAALIWLLLASAQAVQAEEYDPGFAEYDPKRVCYQQWCFMGNEPGTIVLPDHYPDGVGLGVFIDRKHIEFSEMPFAKGVYRVESLVEINVQGRMEVGHLSFREALDTANAINAC